MVGGKGTGAETVAAITNQFGLTYPTLHWLDFAREYGWVSGDDRILLNREGKMIAMMDELLTPWIEERVVRALAAP